MSVTRGVYITLGQDRVELCLAAGATRQDRKPMDERIDQARKGTVLPEDWVPPVVELHREDNGKPLRYADCPDIGNDSSFVFRPKVVQVMGEMLLRYGELRQITCPGEDLLIYNVTNVIDALDGEKTVLGKIAKYECPVFLPDTVEGQDIFKIPNEVFSSIYVSHRFVDLWKSNKLVGLKFVNVEDLTPNWGLRGKVPYVR